MDDSEREPTEINVSGDGTTNLTVLQGLLRQYEESVRDPDVGPSPVSPSGDAAPLLDDLLKCFLTPPDEDPLMYQEFNSRSTEYKDKMIKALMLHAIGPADPQALTSERRVTELRAVLDVHKTYWNKWDETLTSETGVQLELQFFGCPGAGTFSLIKSLTAQPSPEGQRDRRRRDGGRKKTAPHIMRRTVADGVSYLQVGLRYVYLPCHIRLLDADVPVVSVITVRANHPVDNIRAALNEWCNFLVGQQRGGKTIAFIVAKRSDKLTNKGCTKVDDMLQLVAGRWRNMLTIKSYFVDATNELFPGLVSLKDEIIRLKKQLGGLSEYTGFVHSSLKVIQKRCGNKDTTTLAKFSGQLSMALIEEILGGEHLDLATSATKDILTAVRKDHCLKAISALEILHKKGKMFYFPESDVIYLKPMSLVTDVVRRMFSKPSRVARWMEAKQASRKASLIMAQSCAVTLGISFGVSNGIGHRLGSSAFQTRRSPAVPITVSWRPSSPVASGRKRVIVYRPVGSNGDRHNESVTIAAAPDTDIGEGDHGFLARSLSDIQLSPAFIHAAFLALKDDLEYDSTHGFWRDGAWVAARWGTVVFVFLDKWRTQLTVLVHCRAGIWRKPHLERAWQCVSRVPALVSPGSQVDVVKALPVEVIQVTSA